LIGNFQDLVCWVNIIKAPSTDQHDHNGCETHSYQKHEEEENGAQPSPNSKQVASSPGRFFDLL
jgi:hypothetical protein